MRSETVMAGDRVEYDGDLWRVIWARDEEVGIQLGQMALKLPLSEVKPVEPLSWTEVTA